MAQIIAEIAHRSTDEGNSARMRFYSIFLQNLPQYIEGISYYHLFPIAIEKRNLFTTAL